MNKLESLYYSRDDLIPFEEFEWAGWNLETYLQYLSLCENVRATTIFLANSDTYKLCTRKCGFSDNDKNSIFNTSLKTLTNWLSTYFSNSIEISYSYALAKMYLTHTDKSDIPMHPLNNNYKTPEQNLVSLIYLSPESFRRTIEEIIGDMVIYNKKIEFLFPLDYRDFTNNELLRVKKTKESEVLALKPMCSISPDFPNDYGIINNYRLLEDWARAQNEYYTNYEDLFELYDDLEDINEMIKDKKEKGYHNLSKRQLLNEKTIKETEREVILNEINNIGTGDDDTNDTNNSLYFLKEKLQIITIDIADIIELLEDINSEKFKQFQYRKHTLYIYSHPRRCQEKQHTVTSLTASVKTLESKSVDINIAYCENCDKFFIDYNQYKNYMKKYKCLLIKWVDLSEHKNDLYLRNPYSTLRLCGYTVGQKQGFTQQQRQDLLTTLIDEEIISKDEIINQISIFISTNGRNPNNAEAKIKWESDLYFVQNYNLQKQNKVTIDNIESSSKSIKIE